MSWVLQLVLLQVVDLVVVIIGVERGARREMRSVRIDFAVGDHLIADGRVVKLQVAANRVRKGYASTLFNLDGIQHPALQVVEVHLRKRVLRRDGDVVGSG